VEARKGKKNLFEEKNHGAPFPLATGSPPIGQVILGMGHSMGDKDDRDGGLTVSNLLVQGDQAASSPARETTDGT